MKKKGLLVAALSLCAVSVIAVGTTLALLNDKTDEKVNKFTVSQNGIKIELRELKWDNDPFTGETAPTVDEAALGINKAQNIVPLREIPKDPTVKNTGDHDAWVAIKLEYTWNENPETSLADKTKVPYATLAGQVDFEINDGWIPADDTRTVYYYNAKLAAGAKTATALFDKVTIKDVEEVHAFDIIATAYAIQAEGVTADNYQTELLNFINQ